VAPKTAGGFVPKREPALGLESGVVSASALGSGLGRRLNVPDLIPANGLGAAVVAGFVASSAVDFASGFGAPPSENPVKSSGSTEAAVGPGVAKGDEGLSLRAGPLVVGSGGVFGPAIADNVGTLTGRSTKGSALAGGGVDLTSVGGGGEGTLELVSHCPNGIFGDAGRGLSKGDFSPLTSSSSPPDTGVFARGELRTGRVLGLPRPILLEPGDGVSEGDGSEGVGCWSGVCNDNGPFDGDSGGVVLRAREVDGS